MNHFETSPLKDDQSARVWTSAPVARSAAKRLIDVVLAGLALAFLAPFLGLVALLISLDDHGPVMFRQTRTGLCGRPFRIYKFRTMTVAEESHHVRQATRGDQRVTRIGAILRTLSIDELPQLLNILKGDMSLVGPRPHALAHDEAWQAMVPAYAARFRARPGLTGYAQVQGYRGEIHNGNDILRRVEADNYYIENWSIWLELEILIRTVPRIFHDPRAY